eukprot:EG_transcript_25608
MLCGVLAHLPPCATMGCSASNSVNERANPKTARGGGGGPGSGASLPWRLAMNKLSVLAAATSVGSELSLLGGPPGPPRGRVNNWGGPDHPLVKRNRKRK